jgi:lantibiotic modifying enzyme
MMNRRDLLRAGAGMAALGASPHELIARLTRDDDRPYLEAARRAERWIRRSAVRDGNSVTWPWDPEATKKVETSLYTGAAGVILFYLELHHATGDSEYLEEAARGARWLEVSLPDEIKDGNAGLYTGVAGAAYVLEMVHKATGRGDFRSASDRALGLVLRAARQEGEGAKWNDSTDII